MPVTEKHRPAINPTFKPVIMFCGEILERTVLIRSYLVSKAVMEGPVASLVRAGTMSALAKGALRALLVARGRTRANRRDRAYPKGIAPLRTNGGQALF